MKAHYWLAAIASLALVAGCDQGTGPITEHEEGETHADEAGHEGSPAPASTRITAEAAQASGVRVAPVGPGTIADRHQAQGVLIPLEDRSAQVTARYPGVIRDLRASIGDRVGKGQPVAVIESNLSLSNYTIVAPITGTVMQREGAIGGVAGEGMPLYEIADLSELAVELNVFGRDVLTLKPGTPVTIVRTSDGATADTTIDRILPGAAADNQRVRARARLRNTDGQWQPGAVVRAEVALGGNSADLVVPVTALQESAGRDVVYVQEGDLYTARVVRVGRRDSRHAEILDGLEAGQSVVVQQSFLIKADIEKSTAEHEH